MKYFKPKKSRNFTTRATTDQETTRSTKPKT